MKVVSFFFPNIHFIKLTFQYSLVQRKLLNHSKVESLNSHASFFFFKQSLALIESLVIPKYDAQKKKKKNPSGISIFLCKL